MDKGYIIQDVNIIRRNAADAAAGSTTSFKYDPDLRMSKILVRMLRSLDTEKCNVSSPVPPPSQPAPNQADSMNMNDASQGEKLLVNWGEYRVKIQSHPPRGMNHWMITWKAKSFW